MIFDESGLGQEQKEAAEYANLPGGDLQAKPWAQIQEQIERGARYAINGRVFGNLSGLEMNEGERVRWYLFGLGSETDLHTAHWHGLRVVEEGRRRTDVVELLPASMKVADMVADNPGTWLFHCHVAEHMMEGMFARVIVHPRGATTLNGAAPFFGLKPAERSLQIDLAQAMLSSTPAAASGEVQLEGSVTVFDAFSVFVAPVQFQLGGKTVSFKPDRHGVAKNSDGSFRVRNANEFGVVFGGTMEFEVKLAGADWMRELSQAGLPEKFNGSREITLPLVVQIGSVRHVSTVRIQARAQ